MKRLISSLLALWLALTAPASAQVRALPEVLDGAFRPGFTVVVPDVAGRVGFRVVEAGRLKVTSGRIVAVDPFTDLAATAFDFQVPAGEYPVRLAVAEFGDDQRVALARLDFRDTPAVRWEMARRPGQSLSDLGRGEIFGYGVDAGTGAFADADAFAWLRQKYSDTLSDAFATVTDRWIRDGETGGTAYDLPNLFLLMPDAGANNIAMYSSGWGDGFYASWVGYDAQGNVSALVTDFAVVTAVTGIEP